MGSKSSGKNIIFRFDYGGQIGRGHLSRCLSLAKAFKEAGREPIFVIRKRPSIAEDKLPFRTIWLEEASDVVSADISCWIVESVESEASEMLNILEPESIVILDHYSLGFSWQQMLISKGHKLILFQDVFSERFEADILINYNFNAEELYSPAFTKARNTRFLLGPQYAPLESVYKKEHSISFQVNSKVEIIGIYLGGVEKKHLETLAGVILGIEYFSNKEIHWVVSSEDEENTLRTTLGFRNLQIHIRIPNLATFYEKAQLFIGTCGVSLIERACLGMWQINFIAADNQKDIANYIEQSRLGFVLGDIRSMNKGEIISKLTNALNLEDENKMEPIQKCFSLVDGDGTSRILKTFFEVGL